MATYTIECSRTVLEVAHITVEALEAGQAIENALGLTDEADWSREDTQEIIVEDVVLED